MAESFFQRWTRRKAEAAGADDAADAQSARRNVTDGTSRKPVRHSDSEPSMRPTMRDIALLNAESDYSAFVAGGVDKAVHRAAMKKLFSDPHFNIMDGLDIYIDDYNKPSPVSAAMLAALQHAKSTLDPQPYRAEPEEEQAEDAPQQDSPAALAAAADADTPDGGPGNEPEEPVRNESSQGARPNPL